jgi:lipoic acid synthetase
MPVPDFLVNPNPKKAFREAIARLPGGLPTICEEAQCPNRGECLPKHRTVSILVMGDVCTRGCPFCAVTTGRPRPLDPEEPARVLELASALDLRYLVMTSPNRDDLPDGGASHYARIMRALREGRPGMKVEALVPDFRGDEAAYAALLECPPDVVAHDLQTVPRLYPAIRPGADYARSLGLFRWFFRHADPGRVSLKGGMMVGFGEREEEVVEVLGDARGSGVSSFTIGQYLRPPGADLQASETVPLERYARFTEAGARLGLKVQASPLTRSSYRAETLNGAARP